MANSTRPLTISYLEKLKPASKLFWVTDAKQEGLQLGVTPRGVKTFYYRYRSSGKSVREKLGRWPDLTLDQARDLVRGRLTAKHGGPLVADAAKTFSDAFRVWMDGYARKAKRTWEEDERKFNRDLTALHDVPLATLTQTAVERLHNDLKDSNGPVHANRCLALIKAVLNYVIDRDDFPYSAKNPARGVTKFPEKERERFLSQDELVRFSRALLREDDLWRDFFTVCLFTGSRRGNVQSMRWEDLDLDRAEWLIPETKSGKSQRIPLTANVVEILKQRRADAHPKCRWVFPSKRRPFCHIVDCRKSWERITRAAELKDVHIHDLRRTLASHQAQLGYSELMIAKTLGHASGSKATAVYARLDTASVRQAVEATGKVLIEAMAVPAAEEGGRDE